jgi:integrase
MTLLSAHFPFSPSASVRNALGEHSDHLYTYINKYDASIPIILSDCGEVVREAHSFLYEKHNLSRGMSSDRTVLTYAESLSHWFRYCKENDLCWREFSVSSLLKYRNSMRSTSNHREKNLRTATINLRVTVVVEFIKFLILGGSDNEIRTEEARYFLAKLGRAKLKLRRTHSRPIALSPENCKKICNVLRSTHRLIFIWAISTGLRTSSILSVTLKQLEAIESSRGGFVEVITKGGKWQKVFLPAYVLEETKKYIRIDRKILLLRGGLGGAESNFLFVNQKGGAIDRRCYYAAYKRACKVLRVNSHPHQARTTFATFMDRRLRAYGEEHKLDHIKIIQGLLGHASSITTEDYLESLEINNIEILNLLEEHAGVFGAAHE